MVTPHWFCPDWLTHSWPHLSVAVSLSLSTLRTTYTMSGNCTLPTQCDRSGEQLSGTTVTSEEMQSDEGKSEFYPFSLSWGFWSCSVRLSLNVKVAWWPVIDGLLLSVVYLFIFIHVFKEFQAIASIFSGWHQGGIWCVGNTQAGLSEKAFVCSLVEENMTMNDYAE